MQCGIKTKAATIMDVFKKVFCAKNCGTALKFRRRFNRLIFNKKDYFLHSRAWPCEVYGLLGPVHVYIKTTDVWKMCAENDTQFLMQRLANSGILF